MEISARVNARLVIAVTEWAARHNASVPDVVERALTEYMLDCDAGLLSPPPPPLRSIVARGAPGRLRKGE